MHEILLKFSMKYTEKVSFLLFFGLLNFWLLLKKFSINILSYKNVLWIVKGHFNASNYE